MLFRMTDLSGVTLRGLHFILWFRSTQEIYMNIVSGHDPYFQLSVFMKKEYGLNKLALLGLVSHCHIWSRRLAVHKS